MTLQQRIEELMRTMNWEHADLMREAGVSHSVASQWRGKGSKAIHSIGKTEAAERLEKATGYASLWIAKGLGPKMAAVELQQPAPAQQAPDMPLPAWLVARLKGLDPFDAGAFTQHALQFFRDQDALRLGEVKTWPEPAQPAANQRP